MRILYFTRDYTTHDRRFLTALVNAGHQLYYLRLERRGHALEERPLPAAVEVVQWAGGQGPVGLRDGPRLLADLERVLASIKPDLVQAGPVQTAAYLSALAAFHPLVSVSWGSDLLVEAERNEWNRWATRFTLSHSDALVGDCNPVRRKAVEFGMPDERIVTFPWGVDLRHFCPANNPANQPTNQLTTLPPNQHPYLIRASESYCVGHKVRPTFTLLSTRGWEPIYGVDVIARAFVLAAREHPELRLIMLGGGSQAGLLRQIFSQGGVVERVVFPGQVGQASLPECYREADLYVSASHSDGTSISLLEALACGRPALVSDIPGNREWIEPGVQGWWFPDGDVNALAQAILHAVEDRSRLGEMGRAARQLAEQRADWDQNFPQLFRAYQIALNR